MSYQTPSLTQTAGALTDGMMNLYSSDTRALAKAKMQELQAEAEKEKRIKEAEGEAEAILKVQQANADGIRFIREAGADQAVLTIKSLEAFEKAADGKATKIIIPSELQSLAGLVKSAKEVIKED